MRSILVAIPTYNERDNISSIVKSLRDLRLDIDILFVDDNSPDGTAEAIRVIAENDKRIFLLERPGKLGIGSAHRDALLWASSHEYEFVVTMDCDLTHDPVVLPRFLRLAGKADVVIGSRHLQPGSLPGWAWWRKILTTLGYFATGFFLKLPYDATGALRLYDLRRVPIEIFLMVQANGYAFFFESLYLLWKNGFHIVEVPIVLPARTYGSSKMSRAQVIISLERLVLVYLTSRISPDVYQLRRAGRNPSLLRFQNSHDEWDAYWGSNRSETPKMLLYEIIALIFRSICIRPWLNRIAREVFHEDSLLLHAGCGSGQVDLNIRQHFEIIALDRSVAAGICCYYNNDPHERICIGDLFSLPFADGLFDGLYNVGVMEHFEEKDLRSALSELSRVTKPGGKLVFFWPTVNNFPGKVLECFGLFASHDKESSPNSFIPKEVSKFKSVAQIQPWFEAAGLLVLEVRTTFRDLGTQAAVIAQKI